MNEQQIWNAEHLMGLEEDMNDADKSWKDAEKELISAREWRDKMVLNYANSTIKYMDFRKSITPELPPEVINLKTELD